MAAAAAAPSGSDEPPCWLSCSSERLEVGGVLTSAPGLLTFTLTSSAPFALYVRLSCSLGEAVAFQEWNENLGHVEDSTASSVAPGAAPPIVGEKGELLLQDEEPEDQSALFHEVGLVESVRLEAGESRRLVLVFRPSYAQVSGGTQPEGGERGEVGRIGAAPGEGGGSGILLYTSLVGWRFPLSTASCAILPSSRPP